MQREILFTGKRTSDRQWIYGSLISWSDGDRQIVCADQDRTSNRFEVIPETVGQYTGHIVNKVDLFEGNILRNTKISDEEDENEYLVCMFIKEWAMFGLLTVDEYHAYLSDGAESLDESMFWTFPIDDKENEQRRICGNVHDNPELLKPEQATEQESAEGSVEG